MTSVGRAPGGGAPLQSHLSEDLCLDLLRGFLSRDERDRVLAHVEACAECETLFVRWAAREERVRARGELRVGPAGELTLKPYSVEERGSAPPVRGFSWRRLLRPAFGVAAAAAAAVVLFLAIPRSGGDDPAGMLRPIPGVGEQIHLRGDPPAASRESFELGVDAYERGDLRAAIERLENVGATGRLDDLRRVYLGSAYARLGEYEDAVRELEAVPFVAVPDPWGGEARWTLYVAYRALGRTAEAETVLEELAREPGEFGERARDALNER